MITVIGYSLRRQGNKLHVGFVPYPFPCESRDISSGVFHNSLGELPCASYCLNYAEIVGFRFSEVLCDESAEQSTF
jgi:hypothetical protein